MRRCLEREVDASAGHSEVVLRTRNDVPAEIVQQTNVRGEANFETAADLTNELGLRSWELVIDDSKGLRGSEKKLVILAAAEDSAAAEPEVWREAGTADRETQG